MLSRFLNSPALVLAIGFCVMIAPCAFAIDKSPEYKVVRFFENPIITPAMMGDVKENINGPTLIKVPDWVKNRLGKYYLYFSHHEGLYIRLAYADNLHGPWKIYEPGVLNVKDIKGTPDHVASPDAIIDDSKQEIRLYVHAPTAAVLKSTDPQYAEKIGESKQDTFVAISKDGLNFRVVPEIIGEWYFRVWKWKDCYYAIARGGSPLYRSKDGITPFEKAPQSPFDKDPEFKKIRHTAVMLDGNMMTVFYSRIGDTPEHIMMSKVKLTPDWEDWRATKPVSFLRPETGYEGVNLPLAPSKVGMTIPRVNELRDPAIFQENGKTYLLYTVEGEYGIAIAELQKVKKKR